MIILFTIKEFPELFTVADYKYVLKNVKTHFLEECDNQKIQVQYANVYYNPEDNVGIVEYDFINHSGRAYISEMDLPFPNDCITILFE
jgi:hypothetical protein